MKTFQRILAVILALVMSLSVIGVTAFAASTFDSSKTTGTLTIHKLEKGENAGEPIDSTGTTQTPPANYTALKDVTFTVYQIMDKAGFENYLNYATANEALDPADYYTYDATTKTYTVKVNGQTVTGTPKTTGEDGTVTFTLDLGLYLVIETSYPDKVTQPTTPFLVSIPLTDPSDENEWLYDVVVYPKNSTSEGAITLIKKGENDAALDAKFELQKFDGTNPIKVAEYETGDDGTVSIENLAHGDYQLIEQSVNADGYVVDKTPITFTIDENSKVTYTSTDRANVEVTGDGEKAMTITVTNEKPDVTKEVTENTNATPGVGETVNFTVTVEVPTNIADMTAFTVADAPVNLAVNDNSVAVLDGSTAVSTDLYDVNYEGDGFVLTFDVEDENISNIAGKTLTITYDAVVQESAASAGTTGNEVTLTYHDGVREQTDTADTTQKYFKIDITKWKDAAGTDNGGTLAPEVNFELYDANNNIVAVTTTATGNYIYDANGTVNTTLTTDSSGKLVVSGLPAGTYYLKETLAPNGYNLLKDEIEITLNETDVSDLSYELNVINKKGFDLPQTGGIGTLMFILMGGVLIAGGICLIAVPNKKRSV